MRILPLVLSILALATPVAAEERRYFKDWLTVCQDDGYCSATAYVNPNPPSGTVADYILRVGRHAEQSYWEISISTVATMANESADFTIMVDGQPTIFSTHEEVGAYGSINDFFFLGEKAQAVMDLMTPGKKVSISFTDTEGVLQTADFPLTGLTAAQIWIDEQQRRIGSERVAAAAPYGLTPAGGDQGETPQVPTDLLDIRNAERECRPLEEIENGRDFVVADLGEGATLYVIPCDSFAYNFTSQVYVYDGFEYRQQYFADFSASTGWTGAPVLFSAGYDPATKTLTSFYKGRGLGDCGTAGTWVWTGYMFEMTEYRSKGNCDGAEADWPVVFTHKPSSEGPPAAGQ